jgi:hypothetical protein
MILPLQNGHAAGRATTSASLESRISFVSSSECKNPERAALPCELRWMRRAVFGEPLGAHPPKIGWIGAPGSTHLVEHHRAAGGDESCDGEQHGLDAAGTRRVIASIVPDRAAFVCAVVHICTRSFRGAPDFGISLTAVTG